jgi:hypothetical protein
MVTTRQPRATATKKTTRKTAVKKVVTRKAVIRKAPLKAPLQATKPAKIKKPKLIRDSFTIPKDEYAVIDILKARALKFAHPMKKSELLRAGVKALAAMSDIQFKTALKNVPTIKTGRPKSSK